MKKKSLILLLFLLVLPVNDIEAQDSVTLSECFEKAASNHKLAHEKEKYSSINDLTAGILKKAWLPVADAGASYIYNSDVVDLGGALSAIPVPGLADAISPIPHSQYRLTVDISQMIYDGGLTRERVRSDEAAMRLNQQLSDVELYSAREMIINCFYGIVILDRQSELIGSYIITLESRLKALESAISSGILTPSDYDLLLAEKLKLRQKADENLIMSTTLRRILSDITGADINEATRLVINIEEPGQKDLKETELTRPELEIFNLSSEQLKASEGLLDAQRRPKVYGFATLGYGNPPGNNFFRDSFEPFFVAGASLKWNIHDWNRTRQQKAIIAIKKEITESRKNDTEVSIRRMLESKRAEIESIKSAIITGNEIVTLRKRISSAALSAFKNGTITASEYLAGTNQEREAVIALEISKIALLKAESEYCFISGQEK